VRKKKLKKKKKFVCFFGVDVAGVFCGGFLSCLWLPVLSVVVGVRWQVWCSNHRKEKKFRRFDCVVKTVICGHRLVPLLLFFEVVGLFCLLRQVSASSGGTPAKVRRASSGCFCSVFSVFLLFLGIVGMFCVFPASFETPTKFCIFRRVSGEVSSSCFPANLVG
jgi:hypothetical protein